MSESCAAADDDVPLAARKVAAQTLRWLRDWATCLGRAGYDDAACEVRLGSGSNAAAVLRRTGLALRNELVCNEAQCTRDLGRALDHCEGKFLYEGKCSLDDWDKVWRWIGDPPLPLSGTCSNTGTSCLADGDCGAEEHCARPSSCDVYRYTPEGWEPCRCIQEAFVKPQIDEWLGALRAMDPGPAPSCAAAALNTMGEAIGYIIDAGCMDPTDRSCVAAGEMCRTQWSALALKNGCGSCELGADGSCPVRCDGAQIDCSTWMGWCAAAEARFMPLRRGTRQLPGIP
jgi:hypothetical protein